MGTPKAPVKAWIVAQREAKGWEAWDLAEKLGVSYSTVRGWEAASGGKPNARNIQRLETLFGITAPGSPDALGQVDLTAVVAAIDPQTDALERRTKALD